MPTVGAVSASPLTSIAAKVIREGEDALTQRIAAENLQGLRNAIAFFKARREDTSILQGMLKERLTQST